MPAHIFVTNFSSGEITEQMGARVDLQKYQNGAHCLRNMVVKVHGGAHRRAGTTFIAETKASGAFQFDAFQEDTFEIGVGSTAVRLVDFQFSVEQAYMLEMGHGYIRFFKNRTQIMDGADPLEIASPYAGEHLRQLRFTQSADVLYIAHQAYPPHKLLRVDVDAFELREINFYPPPTVEQDEFPNATLTLANPTGIAVTVTASNPSFLPADIGRTITAGAGVASIHTFVSQTEVSVNITVPFFGVVFAPGDWALHGSPNNALLSYASVGPVNLLQTITASNDAWRIDHVGKYIMMADGGIAKIQSVTNSAVASILILATLPVGGQAPGTWTLESPAWSEDLGYPGVVCLFEQRLRFSGSPFFPDTSWASVVADYENFARGPLADDAYQFTIAAPRVNMIRWEKGLKTLLTGTVGGEYQTRGPDGGPITADSAPDIDEEGTWGSDFDVDAIRVANVLMFLQRGKRKVRELAFSFEADGFLSPDLSILAEHLLRDGILEMAYLPQPESTLLCIRADGVLLGMTYERPENVVAWHQHATDGRFISVGVIPNPCGTGDEIWTAVERELPLSAIAFQTDAFDDGGFQVEEDASVELRRFIEVFDGALSTDSSLVYEGVPVAVLGGIGHLENKEVACILRDRPFQADSFQEDAFQAERATVERVSVVGGQVILASAVGQIQVGLGYENELSLLRPEIVTQKGSIQGQRQHYSRVTVRFYATSGRPLVNDEPVEIPVDAEDPFTGDVTILTQGWHRGENRVRIRQVEPLPMAVLGVGAAIQVEDG